MATSNKVFVSPGVYTSERDLSFVAQSVGEVQDGCFGYRRRILSHVEMGGLDRTLGDGMRHEEEIELSIFDFTLFDEASVNVSSLGRVLDELITLGSLSLLEESLSDTLVYDDQGNLGRLDGSGNGVFVLLLLSGGFSRSGGVLGICLILLCLEDAVLLGDDLVELVELFVNDHLSHGITDTISVDEDVVWELAIVVVSESLESALEVLLEHARADDLLTFLTLRARLSVVLAHVLIVGGAEANDALLALVADVDTDEHGLSRDLSAKVEAPEVTAELGVDLPEDVDVDPVVVLLDGLARDELGDDRAVGVDLVLQCRVEVLLLDRVWHDNEEEVEVLGLSGLGKLSAVCVFATNILEVVVVDRLLEGLDSGLVAELNDVSIVDVDVKAPLL